MFNTSYVCFDCRRCVKHPVFVRREKNIADLVRAPAPRCPECAAVMIDVGKRFKAPRKGDLKQWKKVRMMVEGGFSFYSYAQTPDTPKQVASFLEALDKPRFREPQHPHRSLRSRRKWKSKRWPFK